MSVRNAQCNAEDSSNISPYIHNCEQRQQQKNCDPRELKVATVREESKMQRSGRLSMLTYTQISHHFDVEV